MIVLATDAPLSARNLERMAKRAALGLARTGSFLDNGSGDFVIAFSTASQVVYDNVATIQENVTLTNDAMSPLFLATVEAVEEAVLNSLFKATTVTGFEGHTREAFPIEIVQEMMDSGEETVNQEEHDRRIDYIELPTTDMAEAKAFYTGVFGWTTQDWGPDYTSFEDGRLAGGFRYEAEVTRGGPLVVLYAVDLEAVEVAVRSHGGAVVKEIFSFPGGRRFHFTDPSGNELAVWSDK